MRYTRQDLEKLANHTVAISLKTGDSLVDSVLSVLKSNPMNPEQTRRLAEMANTEMFLQKFKNTSGDDRFVDFQVIDPVDLIRKSLGEDPKPAFSSSKSLTVSIKSGPEGTHVTRSLKQDPGLDTEDSRFYEDITPTKLDSLNFDDVINGASLSGEEEKKASHPSENDINRTLAASERARRLQESLLDKIAHTNYKCEELSSSLSRKFKGIYSRKKHANFEQEALANFGKSSLPALQAVRSKLGMPLLSGNVSEGQIKQASDRYVSDKTSIGMKEVGEFIENVREYEVAKEASATLTKAASSFLGALPTEDTFKGIGYQAARRLIPLTDRIRVIDESANQVRQRVVENLMERVEDSFEDRRRASRLQDLKDARRATIREMILTNPDMKASGKKNVMTAVNTLSKLAPELSTDLPFLTSHVRQMLHNSAGGVPSLDSQSIAAITKAEKSFTSLNDSNSNPYR